MSGAKTDKEKLNHTLEVVANILHKENINDWFIMFGTLLGIVRGNECIEGDDDIDIMINCDYSRLRNAFESHGFTFTSKHRIKNPDTILKSEPNEEFASVDFYLCEVSNDDYYTPWHRVKSRDSLPFVEKKWRSTTLNLPNGYLDKVVSMYGKNWKTPQSAQCPMRIHI